MSNVSEPEKEIADNERRSREGTAGSIWDDIDEIMLGVPEAVLSRLPADGAERHDHYLHGAHRKEKQDS